MATEPDKPEIEEKGVIDPRWFPATVDAAGLMILVSKVRVGEPLPISYSARCSSLDPSHLSLLEPKTNLPNAQILRLSGSNAGMANFQAANGLRGSRRRRDDSSELDDEETLKSRSKERVTLNPDASEVRRIRIERLEEGASRTRTNASLSNMTSESHATLTSSKSTSSHRRRKHRSPKESEHRRRRKSPRRESTTRYVYGAPDVVADAPRITASETRRSGGDGEEDDSSKGDDSQTETIKPRKRRVKVIYVPEEQTRLVYSSRRVREEPGEVLDHPREAGSIRRSRSHRHRKFIPELPRSPETKRRTSIREAPSDIRPVLKRSHNTVSHASTSNPQFTASSIDNSKRTSFLSSFFGPQITRAQQHQEPERLVECLTCLSDDIPRSKSAKLKCGHRMCHSCLRRIFKLSVTDPQHMPPKCCTPDHIPLKHVERLFDINFKKTWNRKFQEYTTQNRIYCPARRCGEWIKPGNIHKEDGREYGKCSRSEFCMICGLKWKSCNCPWFNYEAVEEDRLNHMQIPRPAAEEDLPRPFHLRRPRPNTYHDEMDQRRRQERQDEELARRLQTVNIRDNDYQGGIGDIHGIGNNAGHFMNEDYIRAAAPIIAGRFNPAIAAANHVMGINRERGVPPQPPAPRMAERYPTGLPVERPPARSSQQPLARRHTVRDQDYTRTLAEEIILPRRAQTDYETQAAIHRPLGRTPSTSVPSRSPRPSILAGLGGGRGNNRVNAWRSHVELGVTPEEGVL
ncbi:hypothetical protein B7494_g5330 [Chlorociboria aeruginascens]|nr:hypothetical protein B7494_g5330 [Chlorociboria aeruginascens]